MEALTYAYLYATERLQEFLVFLFVASSVAIFLTGSLKMLLLKKVEKKGMRKLACFLSGIAFTCGVSAFWFAIDGVPFEYYIPALLLVVPTEIVLYQFYENFMLRDAIDFVAKKFLTKVIPIIATSLEEGSTNEETKLKLIEATASVKTAAKTKIKEIAQDGDLKNI